MLRDVVTEERERHPDSAYTIGNHSGKVNQETSGMGDSTSWFVSLYRYDRHNDIKSNLGRNHGMFRESTFV